MKTTANRQPPRLTDKSKAKVPTETQSAVRPNGRAPLVAADPVDTDLDYLDPVDLASAMSFPASDPPAPFIPEPKLAP